MQKKLTEIFQQQFNFSPTHFIKAPGRVNLIGEHTDYNDGFVLPMAIDRYIWLAISPREDRQVQIYSVDFQETQTFSLDDLQKNRSWIEYVKGIAWMLHPEAGFSGVLHGNIPQGAGLSSSAALELAVAKVFAEISNLTWDPKKMAKLAQKAENQWVGVNCGIMDQMIIAVAQENHALLIDCRDLTTKPVPLPKDVSIVIMDTATRRGLVDSAYNERRQQCEEAARILGVKTLRDIKKLPVGARRTMPGKRAVPLQRARHVISENQRVLDAVDAMQQNDPIKLGELINASHESLRDDYEVSSQNLDIMVNCARNAVGCYGARMTGAGFAGCAIALVKEMYADDFVYQVAEQYEHETQLQPSLYVSKAMSGVVIEPRIF
jgi:galactokinase